MWYELRDYLLGCGAALVGCADLADLPEERSAGYPRAVSIAIALRPESVAESIRVGHRPAHPDTPQYAALQAFGEMTADRLRVAGGRAEVAHTTGQARVHHKDVAARAGLGWLGRCSLLVTPEFGSAVRLISVLTDAPLPADEPITESQCADCTACVDACPVGAPSGRQWRTGMQDPQILDIEACREAKRALELEAGQCCQRCMGACPYTQAWLARCGVGVA